MLTRVAEALGWAKDLQARPASPAPNAGKSTAKPSQSPQPRHPPKEGPVPNAKSVAKPSPKPAKVCPAAWGQLSPPPPPKQRHPLPCRGVQGLFGPPCGPGPA